MKHDYVTQKWDKDRDQKYKEEVVEYNGVNTGLSVRMSRCPCGPGIKAIMADHFGIEGSTRPPGRFGVFPHGRWATLDSC